ncbi:hypothetical protein G7A66_07310 [Altererythrobacter sp. SALINAS58]|uniref:hypothetical protein n=1 Tax=Alteripontixanthobacter muriae TaxID=2705546 RepID=UPI0019D67C13|nr:hypothetical protein [Alteripontixanthobacter muriae]NTZ42895.1 hypothetical protein [Alteripontixanthobacter muriae]
MIVSFNSSIVRFFASVFRPETFLRVFAEAGVFSMRRGCAAAIFLAALAFGARRLGAVASEPEGLLSGDAFAFSVTMEAAVSSLAGAATASRIASIRTALPPSFCSAELFWDSSAIAILAFCCTAQIATAVTDFKKFIVRCNMPLSACITAAYACMP